MQIEVEDIILYKSLGKGSFGEVFLTKRKGLPDQIFATKKVPKSLVSSPKVKKYSASYQQSCILWLGRA